MPAPGPLAPLRRFQGFHALLPPGLLRALMPPVLLLLLALPAHADAVQSFSKQELAAFMAEAEAGSEMHQKILAYLYAEGNPPNLPRDDAKAFYWLHRLAPAGDPKINYLLGIFYMTGRGTPHDMAKGKHHLYVALCGGVVQAAYNMLDVMLTPFHPLYDPAEAVRWLEKGASMGDARCIYNLGAMLEQGMGAPQDIPRAEQLYRQAVAKGYPNAMNQLAVLIDSGRAGVSDRGEAVRLFRMAAEQGHGLAAYNLGLMLREGRGTDTDWPQAAYWLACADALGEPRATDELAALSARLSPAQRETLDRRLREAPLPPRRERDTD